MRNGASTRYRSLMPSEAEILGSGTPEDDKMEVGSAWMSATLTPRCRRGARLPIHVNNVGGHYIHESNKFFLPRASGAPSPSSSARRYGWDGPGDEKQRRSDPCQRNTLMRLNCSASGTPYFSPISASRARERSSRSWLRGPTWLKWECNAFWRVSK